VLISEDNFFSRGVTPGQKKRAFVLKFAVAHQFEETKGARSYLESRGNVLTILSKRSIIAVTSGILNRRTTAKYVNP